MPDKNDWLFDVIWDLSDRANDAGLPVLAGKLEEAMDTYLAERRTGIVGNMQFQNRRKKAARLLIPGMRGRDARIKRRRATIQLSTEIRVGPAGRRGAKLRLANCRRAAEKVH